MIGAAVGVVTFGLGPSSVFRPSAGAREQAAGGGTDAEASSSNGSSSGGSAPSGPGGTGAGSSGSSGPGTAASASPSSGAPATCSGLATGSLSPFVVHFGKAHLERLPEQASDALSVDQYAKTHTVLFEQMLAPSFDALTGSASR